MEATFFKPCLPGRICWAGLFLCREQGTCWCSSLTLCDTEPPASYTWRNRIALPRSMCVTVSNPHEALPQTSLCQYIHSLFFILIVSINKKKLRWGWKYPSFWYHSSKLHLFWFFCLFNFGTFRVFPIVLVFFIFSQPQESINSKEDRQVGNCLCNQQYRFGENQTASE